MTLLEKVCLLIQVDMPFLYFHSLIKGNVAFCPQFGITLYFFNWHTRVFQTLDKFNPCKVFVRITAAVTGIAFRRNQIFMLVVTQGMYP